MSPYRKKKSVFLRKPGHGRGRGVANQNSTTGPGEKFNRTGENKQISISCRSKSSTVDQQIYHKSKNACDAKPIGTPKNAVKRFQEASCLMRESVQRHLQSVPVISDDDDSSEEELAVNVLETVFESYSGTYGVGVTEASQVSKAQEDLLHSFRSNISACLVCIESIRKTDPIWNCLGCFCMFHIQCIQKWVYEGVHQQNVKQNSFADTTTVPWYCPKCRFEYQQKDCPVRYTCFCSKEDDPAFDPWLVPHSCGQTCGKQLQPFCGHTCLLLCHPGPCPPCPKTVEVLCYCQRAPSQIRRCSDKAWSCGQACKRLLPCNQHHCHLPCHEEECPPCTRTSQQKCFCGNKISIRLCANPQWQCDKICGKLLSCGNHTCEQLCHAGRCGPCPRSGPRKCPCGKMSVQLPCTEDIPNCGDTCGKDLACGVHQCQQRCHTGQCDICRQTLVKKCRCSQRQKEVPCCKDYICEVKCQKLRNCTRHQCKRKCCEGTCPTCEQVCGRLLSCRNHKCIAKCHQGPCYPCTLSVDIYCFCKSTWITVPCGREKFTRPPRCNQNCRIPSDCHHPLRKPHRCHFGSCPSCDEVCDKPLTSCGHKCPELCHDVIKVKKKVNPLLYAGNNNIPQFDIIKKPCPPCIEPMKLECLGKHEINEFTCSQLGPYSCKRPCGKQLACTNHTCTLDCHEVIDAPDEKSAGSNCAKCEYECLRKRPQGCNHICLLPCHPGDCPLCVQMFRIRCHCRSIQKHIECFKWSSTDQDTRNNLKSCGQECPKIMSCTHKCNQVCHSGECDPKGCDKKKSIRCKCKRRKKEFSCLQVMSGKAQLPCDEGCNELKLKQQRAAKEAELKKKEEEEKKHQIELEDFNKKIKRTGRKKRYKPSEKTELSFKQKYGHYILALIFPLVAIVVAVYFLKPVVNLINFSLD